MISSRYPTRTPSTVALRTGYSDLGKRQPRKHGPPAPDPHPLRPGTVLPVSELTGREVHLAARPTGWPTPNNFALVDVAVPRPEPGQVLVHNRYMSVDPYMRGRIDR